MQNEELTKYVANERARGVKDADIKNALLSQGWKVEDVDAAIGSVEPASQEIPKGSWFTHMFEGRLNRSEYFVTGFIFGAILLIASYVVSLALGSLAGNLLWLIALPVSLGLSIRRIHDIGWSGWLSVLLFIPIINFIAGLVFLFTKGTEGPNAYGAPQGTRSFLKNLLND